jgi:hypothetical protein
VFQERWSRIPGTVVAAGGVLWLAKLIVIVSTDGRVIDDGAAAVLYLFGLVVLATGSALIGYWLTEGYGALMRIAAGILGVAGFVVVFLLFDAIGSFLVGQRGPAYAADEAGIFLTTVLALAIGAWLWLRASSGAEARTVSRS